MLRKIFVTSQIHIILEKTLLQVGNGVVELTAEQSDQGLTRQGKIPRSDALSSFEVDIELGILVEH